MTTLAMKAATTALEYSVESNGCWKFKGAISYTGYGQISRMGKSMGAHRYSYIKYKGAIPDGYVIDHLCRNRACVNPDHLEAVTQSVNLLRGRLLRGTLSPNGSKTHCPQGHEYTDENTHLSNGSRNCKKCRSIWGKKIVECDLCGSKVTRYNLSGHKRKVHGND